MLSFSKVLSQAGDALMRLVAPKALDVEPLFVLPLEERAFLAVTALGMIAERHEGRVSEAHVLTVAHSYSLDEGEWQALTTFLMRHAIS